MRIRIYRAFSSNNSGSYTLVGWFQDAATAGDVAAALAEVCAAHSAWFEANRGESLDGSPLRDFARDNGLVNLPADTWDHWPQYGPPPRVVHLGQQVVVLVPYTVTMPATVGEYVYRRGGRVSVELDHSHHPLVVDFWFRSPGARYNDAEALARVDALCDALLAELPALCERPEHDPRPVVPPVRYVGDWGLRHLAAVFSDPAEGILRVRERCAEAGIDVHLSISETSGRERDPLAPLREPPADPP